MREDYNASNGRKTARRKIRRKKMKTRTKQTVIALALVCVALVSIFGLAKIASSPKTYSGTIAVLKEKRNTAMGLTAAAAAASVGISAVPGDATTAVADQIMELTSWLLIVVCVIFLEKFLLTLLGYISFTIVIPIACMLGAVYQFVRKTILRDLAIKLGVFGVVLCLMIPLGVQMGEIVEKTHETSIAELTAFADEFEQSKEEKRFWEKLKDGVTDAADQAKQLFWQFVEGVAVMLVTTCLIPVLTMMGIIWLAGKVFGISIPKIKLPRPGKAKKQNENTPCLTE